MPCSFIHSYIPTSFNSDIWLYLINGVSESTRPIVNPIFNKRINKQNCIITYMIPLREDVFKLSPSRKFRIITCNADIIC